MRCPICGSQKNTNNYINKQASLCRYGFMPSRSEALEVTKNLELEILECFDCNFVWNSKFDSCKVNYADLPILESSEHSPAYLDFQKSQATWLTSKISPNTKSILEIGGGSGYFMNHMKANKRVIYEPSGESKYISNDIKVYKKYFDPNLDPIEGEVVIMRQVLEHIKQPFLFLNSILKHTLFSHGYIYIEVPSYDKSKINHRFYDFYYEHCNYFSLNSLARIGLFLNVNIISLGSYFDNELNICLMEYNKHISSDNSFLIEKEKIKSKIDSLIKSDHRIALWGASGNGVALLNELNIDYKSISYVIDDDKRKQGQYIPSTGQEIVSSDSPKLNNINCIFISSQLHMNTISKKCYRQFGDKVKVYNLQGKNL
tara:strand:+ start:130 stop:1245 length:1116 start_codon:yes stop_codon:yes gene_type:complete